MAIQPFQNTTISTIVEVVFVSLRTASTDRLLTLYKCEPLFYGKAVF